MNSSNTSQPDTGDSTSHLIDSITFSMASRNDLQVVQALLRANGLPCEDVGEHIEHFILAWEKDTLVGTVGVELPGSDGLLRSLCVSADERNRGIATLLCNRVESYARNAGVKRLYLLTTTAREFFARRGYSICSRESLPPAMQATAEFRFLCPCTAVCMVRSLDD
ncbi:MAG: GNAT family N-acetyltransferase [Chlorobium sp.]|nr:MAG: GNAT family N-acetyltransferase [Chlorobium sp.]